MKKVLFTLIFISILFSLYAQHTTFSKVIKNTEGIHGYAIEKTFDGNYLIAGGIEDGNGYNKNPSVIKIDTGGNILWGKHYGNLNTGTFNCITSTGDSCYVSAGYYKNASNSTNDILCIKINANGDTIWSRGIDNGTEMAFSVQQTRDNGFILAGQTATDSARAIITKLDPDGNLLWSKSYTNHNYTVWANSVRQTNDGGFIVSGSLNHWESDEKALIMKIDSAGNFLWAKENNILTPNATNALDVAVCSDGYLFLCLDIQNYKLIVVKTDTSGSPQWTKKELFGFFPDYYVTTVSPKLHRSNDSTYYLAFGQAFIKLDHLGNEIIRSGVEMEPAYDVVETSDSGFLVLGQGPGVGVKNHRNYSTQVPIIKTDSAGQGLNCVINSIHQTDTSHFNISPIYLTVKSAGILNALHPAIISDTLTVKIGCIDYSGGVEENSINSINISPNPATTTLTIQTPQTSTIEIFNLEGQCIKTIANAQPTTTIDVSGLPAGIYFIKATSEKGTEVRKFVKE